MPVRCWRSSAADWRRRSASAPNGGAPLLADVTAPVENGRVGPGTARAKQVDEGPEGDPHRGPGARLLPFADGPLVVGQRDRGVAVPGVQRGQGDARKPADEAAARGGGQADRSLQVAPGLGGAVPMAISPLTQATRASADGERPLSRGTGLVRESVASSSRSP